VFLFLDLQKFITARQQLDAQLNENKVVQEVKMSNLLGILFISLTVLETILRNEKYT